MPGPNYFNNQGTLRISDEKVISTTGHFLYVPNRIPNPGSRANSHKYSANYSIFTHFVAPQAVYTLNIPASAYITGFQVKTNTTFNNSPNFTAGVDPQPIPATEAPISVTPVGTPGVTTYTYKVQAQSPNGHWTVLGTATSTTTGNAALSSTNFNTITFAPVYGLGNLGTVAIAVNYNIVRTVGGATQGSIGILPVVPLPVGVLPTGTLSFNDIGQTADGVVAGNAGDWGQSIISGVNLFIPQNNAVFGATNGFLVGTQVQGFAGYPGQTLELNLNVVGATPSTIGDAFVLTNFIMSASNWNYFNS